MGVTKEQVFGYAFNLIGAVLVAYGTMNARMYEVEKKIELLQLQLQDNKETLAQNQNDVKDIKDLFIKIDKSITEINGKLQLKEDKKWR